MEETFNYIISELKKADIRHEVHKFNSGAKMVDVWTNNNFYCIQLDGSKIGISLMTEEIDFSTIPGRSYANLEAFKPELEKIVQGT